MIYILEQRLRAQSIAPDKAKKVLTDVLRTMFSGRFLSELFKPQEVYTNRATRAIFDRLAHSSIMRLNKNSMDKLYDLMTMGFKFQMVHCVQPSQLLTVTVNHLETLKALLMGVGPVQELLDTAIAMSNATYDRMGPGELWRLKQTLCRFFQDRRVKVSLFLQDGLQNMDGTIVLRMAGPLPLGSEPPGTVRYYDHPPAAGAAGASSAASGGAAPSVGPVRRTDAIASLQVPGSHVSTARELRSSCALGQNLYARERKSAAGVGAGASGAAAANGAVSSDPTAPPADAAAGSAADDGAAAGAPALSPPSSAIEPKEAAADHSRASLDLLSALVRGAGAPGGAEGEFKFALFGDDGALAGAGSGDAGAAGDEDPVIVFDADDRTRLQGMMARLGLGEDAASAADRTKSAAAGASAPAAASDSKLGTGDDLLDLMDAL